MVGVSFRVRAILGVAELNNGHHRATRKLILQEPLLSVGVGDHAIRLIALDAKRDLGIAGEAEDALHLPTERHSRQRRKEVRR